jgi:hypothetical protein
VAQGAKKNNLKRLNPQVFKSKHSSPFIRLNLKFGLNLLFPKPLAQGNFLFATQAREMDCRRQDILKPRSKYRVNTPPLAAHYWRSEAERVQGLPWG